MSVIFYPIGVLKSFTQGTDRLVLEGKEGERLEAVCQEIGLPLGLISVFLVNGEVRNKDYLLQPSDEVKLIALIAGG
jgi:molybdopterin converting factor small subunit